MNEAGSLLPTVKFGKLFEDENHVIILARGPDILVDAHSRQPTEMIAGIGPSLSMDIECGKIFMLLFSIWETEREFIIDIIAIY
jgi:hypothetical protein